jgi:tripartite-type tricarboxylate transporter receptor subunit TctC
MNRIMKDAQLAKDRLAPVGLEPVGTTPEKLLDVVKADIQRYLKIAKDANITPE